MAQWSPKYPFANDHGKLLSKLITNTLRSNNPNTLNINRSIVTLITFNEKIKYYETMNHLKRLKNFVAMISFFVVVGFVSCQKVGCKYDSLPSSLFFQLKNGGSVIADSSLNKLKIYYINDGAKTYLTDLIPATDDYAQYGIMTTRQIGFLGSRQYFLEYNNDWENDTLLVDYSDRTQKTDCQYILRQVKFNGTVANADTSFGWQPVYVFEIQ